ncbi:MAG: glycosyltransferase family 2 protein, partial [Cypionkella sp.]|nr:glycosyltransferase family 2 protein [Cypionkella sp.]
MPASPPLDLPQAALQLRAKGQPGRPNKKDKTGVRITALASMRNEGPFIVEWLCWYRMLGFTDAVVVTNNCTDHSPQLLDALQAHGLVHHIRHDVAPGKCRVKQ